MSLLFLNSWRASVIPYYVTTHALQLFKNSIDTQKKLRLNLHSLSVSVSVSVSIDNPEDFWIVYGVSELLEYGR